MILQVNNPSIAPEQKTPYQQLVRFCRHNPVSISDMRGGSQEHRIVEYKYRFAKQLYPEYNYREIGDLLNRSPHTVRHWFTDRPSIELN